MEGRRRGITQPGLILTALLLAVLTLTGSRPGDAEENPFLTGQLLVATPEMRDPRFVESVIYMINHSADGAMGLIINRPLAKGPLSYLLKGLGIRGEETKRQITLHYGGPVQPGRAYVLHTADYVGKETVVVKDGLAVTGDIEVLRAIARGKGPKKSLLAVGYAGWGPGQLEAELKANAWFTIPAEKAFIFDQDAETKWDRARAKRRIKL